MIRGFWLRSGLAVALGAGAPNLGAEPAAPSGPSAAQELNALQATLEKAGLGPKSGGAANGEGLVVEDLKGQPVGRQTSSGGEGAGSLSELLSRFPRSGGDGGGVTEKLQEVLKQRQESLEYLKELEQEL